MSLKNFANCKKNTACDNEKQANILSLLDYCNDRDHKQGKN